jgi:polar amino acid transport system substrate-binding protein
MRIRRALACLLPLFICSVAYAETVTIGAEDSWYPYSGVVNGKPAGFTVDLVRAAFAAENIDVKFESMPYARCTKMVKDGHLLGCFDTARSSMVEADFLWHKKPMFNSRSMIFARASNQQKNVSVAALEGKNVVVCRDYEYGDAFDSNRKVIRQVAKDDYSGFRMLLAGRGDYVLAYEKVAEILIKEHPDEFAGKIIPVGVIEELRLYTVFSKTFPESARYMALFEQGFDQISKNGKVKEIEIRWK